jgi:hypothetical protein
MINILEFSLCFVTVISRSLKYFWEDEYCPYPYEQGIDMLKNSPRATLILGLGNKVSD